jgi:hypothetical protein
MSNQQIDIFVSRLWQHVRLKALGVQGNALLSSQGQVKASLFGFDPVAQWEEVGEALAGHILVCAIKGLSRPSCGSCDKFFCCPKTGGGVCDEFVLNEDVWRSGLVLLYDSIMLLDRVFGIDAGELISVIRHSLFGNEELTYSPSERGV